MDSDSFFEKTFSLTIGIGARSLVSSSGSLFFYSFLDIFLFLDYDTIEKRKCLVNEGGKLMKKTVFIMVVLLGIGSLLWFLLGQDRSTTFGEVYQEVFNDSDIEEVLIEEKLKTNFNSANGQQFDTKKFQDFMAQSSKMKLEESDRPPLNTYEMTIYYKEKGEEKMTAIVVGYNNTLQMADGKFYVITSRNTLFELIYKEL